MSLRNDMAQVMAVLDERNARESEILEVTGLDGKRLARALAALHKRVLALSYRPGTTGAKSWASADRVIARCPWSPDQVLAAIREHGLGTQELVRLSGSAYAPMRALLRRMEVEGRIKLLAFSGSRKWVPASWQRNTAGAWPEVSDDELLQLIGEHQPVKLEQLMDIAGRGRLHLRSRIGVLRRAGLVKHDVVGDSWRYSLAGRARSPQEIEQSILMRCRDVGGDCLRWDGAHNAQGHPLMWHDGNARRVDMVLWTVVHGKPMPRGYTLARSCETPGCCTHGHHRRVTRSEAMRIAFDALGKPWREMHGMRVAAGVRRGDADRDYVRTASPFAGLLERAAA